jgi:3'-phosphoadenosine 5'-phosphosulfate sulfotransferase (PAPS reductase)/FAD synthetase
MDFIQEFSECIINQSAIILHHRSKNSLVSSYLYRSNDYKMFQITDIGLISIDTSFLNTFVKFKLIKFRYNNNVIVYHINVYDKEQVAVETIWRYWKKYRWNFLKNKVEPLKQELMEYIYHPSRLTFDV